MKLATHSEKLSLVSKSAILLLIVTALAQMFMVLRFEANWDEFFLLDWLYQFLRGEFTQPLYSIYFHLLAWVPAVSSNELDQIVTIRALMYCCALVSCIAIYLTSRKFFTTEASLLVLLTFLSFTAVFRHLTSFRIDTMSLAFLMPAVCLCISGKHSLKRSLLVACLIGIAGMITIKSLFIAISIGLILLIRYRQSGWHSAELGHAVLIGVASISVFAGLYAMQSSFLGEADEGSEYLGSVILFSLYDAGFFPEWTTFTILMKSNPVFGLLLTGGFGLTLWQALSNKQFMSKRAVLLLALLFPLLTLFFYRHAHPYYYVHMLAPASILTGVLYEALAQRKSTVALLGLVLVIGLTIGKVFLFSTKQTLDYQRKTVELIHTIFPEPVNYIDRTAMVSSYHKKGIFMSRWGMLEYYNAGDPIMPNVIRQHQPKFLLANIDSLDVANPKAGKSNRPLLPADKEALNSSYVPHWGALYVPGKRFLHEAGGKLQTFEINIPGIYTLESDSPVDIDYQPIANGKTVNLKKGTHRISLKKNNKAVLRWGDNLYRPREEAPDQALFRGF